MRSPFLIGGTVATSNIQLRGLEGVLDVLNSLPAELVGKRGGPVLKALRKGARVIDKERRANLQRVLNNATASGEKESTGLLLSSLIISRGKAPPGGNGERVLLRVKRHAYNRRGKVVTTLATANLLEYGSEKQVAEPWIRPAFNATASDALQVIVNELLVQVDFAVNRLRKSGTR